LTAGISVWIALASSAVNVGTVPDPNRRPPLVELPDMKAAFEVKFWINGSDIPFDHEKYESKCSERLRDSIRKGYRGHLVFIGKKPVSWAQVVGWSRRKGILPIYIPISHETLDSLGKAVDSVDDFDVDGWARLIFARVRPIISFYLSIASGEAVELTAEEQDLVRPFFPENTRIRDIPLLGAFFEVFSCNTKLSHVSRELGCPSTIKARLRQWMIDGTWDAVIGVIARHRFSV
jgi:hypothetical protein